MSIEPNTSSLIISVDSLGDAPITKDLSTVTFTGLQSTYPDSLALDLSASLTPTVPTIVSSGVNVQSVTARGQVTTTEMVRAMMTAYEQVMPTVPTWPSAQDYRLRVRLDIEETMEKFHLGYYYADAVQILDGSCDADVVITGADLTFGFDHDGAVTEVNRSNMSKLVNGKPVKDAGGKVIKPDTYSPANLLPFVGDLANTKPDYDTKAMVIEEFTRALAKRIEMVDFNMLADLLIEKMMSAANPRATIERQALKYMAYVGKVKVFDAGVLKIGETSEEQG